MNTQEDNTIDGQVTEVKAPDNALVILNPQQFATELFKPFEDQLASAKRAAARTKYDIATKDGMAKAKELRATFVSIRTTADKAKTAAKRPIDESGKLILAHFNKLAEAAKAEEAKHDQAIKDEEARIEAEKQAKIAAERARIEAIESRIAHIRNIPASLVAADSTTVSAKLEELIAKRLEPAMYDEHLESAINALNATVDALRDLHEKALNFEAAQRRAAEERAELERLRAEREAAEQRQREEAAERERAAQAERDKAAAEKAELERQLAEMRAQLAAAQPQPAAAPVDEPDAPVVATIEEDHTGGIIGTIEVSDAAPASAPLDIVDAPMPYASAVAVNDPMRVEPTPHVPDDFELIDLVANTYHESRRTALDWLAAINFARAYDNLAEQA